LIAVRCWMLDVRCSGCSAFCPPISRFSFQVSSLIPDPAFYFLLWPRVAFSRAEPRFAIQHPGNQSRYRVPPEAETAEIEGSEPFAWKHNALSGLRRGTLPLDGAGRQGLVFE
jgi:hypothetical protein